MTHVNIGATLGTAAWILWSGHQLVAGEWKPAPAATRPAERSAVPAGACCHAPAPRPAGAPLQVHAGSRWQLALRDGGAR